MKFASAEHYMHALVAALRRPVPTLSSYDHDDEGWARITEERFASSALAKSYSREETRDYRPLVDELATTIWPAIPEDEKNLFRQTVTITVLDHGIANAAIFRCATDRFFAILLNLGLVQLISHYVQLRIAYFYPKTVEYCTRGLPARLKKNDYGQFIAEHLANYQKDGYPNGAKVHLNPLGARRAHLQAWIMELFVLCHELGHYFNGDLDDETLFCPCAAHSGSSQFTDSRDHAMEFNADEIGFSFLLRALNQTQPKIPADTVLEPVRVFFFLLCVLGHQATATHPSPKERAQRLTAKFGSHKSKLKAAQEFAAF